MSGLLDSLHHFDSINTDSLVMMICSETSGIRMLIDTSVFNKYTLLGSGMQLACCEAETEFFLLASAQDTADCGIWTLPCDMFLVHHSAHPNHMVHSFFCRCPQWKLSFCFSAGPNYTPGSAFDLSSRDIK